MTDFSTSAREAEENSAFRFEGTWQEFAPIAFTNLLLTIVTLGIYRFWATTRERQYLWSRSRFVDETLEWNGTGKELFVGFLLVLVLYLLPFFLLSQVAQALILRGQEQLGSLDQPALFRDVLLPRRRRAVQGAAVPPLAHALARHSRR